jgi:hypothetical protein
VENGDDHGNGKAQVDYDGINIPIPRSKYDENGYKPDFDDLPLEADYWLRTRGRPSPVIVVT